MATLKKLNLNLILILILALSLASVRAGQQPRVVNAKLETRSAAAGLEKEFLTVVQSQDRPAWIGYAIPAVAGNHVTCCCDSGRYGQSHGACSLEGDQSFSMNSGDTNLEAPHHFRVLLRVSERKVEKVRTYADDCELNAGGLPLLWFTDVKPAESVALLSGFVSAANGNDRRSDESLGSSALTAIALTADPAADVALDKFAAPGQPESLREKASFWLGAARGRHGFETLRRLVREDANDKLREHAIFGLSVSRERDAIPTMIEIAKNDYAAQVRGRALFWLAQKAGQRATRAITDAINNDPETGVKKQAVFALSRIPKEEGVPLLIQVARTHRNREVRKQAMFWLGQSSDPRALAFFEEVLSR